ncbi:MAG: DUF1501 domain-containing protein [Phycisphaerales bacterium]|nr:DUF1501 domain-containing protein [Phycisphaerales bacterium]
MLHNERECRGCREYQELSRRGFLGTAGAATLTAFATPAWLPRISLAGSFQTRDTLVVVFLRGGMDGLTSIVPYGDPNYNQALRPTLWVPPPGGANTAVDLDGFFGLAPAMGSLLPAYQSGQLLAIHATGSPDPNRSHFDSNKIMEYGTPLQEQILFTGWLARHLQTMPPMGTGPLRAVAFNDLIPIMLVGAPATVPIPDPVEFGFPGSVATAAARRAVVDATYGVAPEPLAGTALSTTATIDLLATIDFENYTPSGGAVYPATPFGDALKSAAALIKADVGVEAATIDKGGWDTHNQQGVFAGDMFTLMTDLANGLAAFHTDMQSHMDSMTAMVMSEFGRRVDENGSFGTDHGHGNAMLLMGGHVNGGQVMANWTGGQLLHPDNLYAGDSLDVTTDYRDVVAEVVSKRLNNPDVNSLFPNYTPTFQGVATV